MGRTGPQTDVVPGLVLPQVVASPRERWRQLTAGGGFVVDVRDSAAPLIVGAVRGATLAPPTDPTHASDLPPHRVHQLAVDPAAAAAAARPATREHPTPGSTAPTSSAVNPLLGADAARWQRTYTLGLAGLDALAILLGLGCTLLARFGGFDAELRGVSYAWVTVAAVPLWLGVISLSRGYEYRYLGLGSEEFRRIANAGLRFIAVVAVIAFATRTELARSLVVLALPIATALALVLRYLARQTLHRRRASGSASHRVLVLGEGAAAQALVDHLAGAPHAGLRVVGTWSPALIRLRSRGAHSSGAVSSGTESSGPDRSGPDRSGPDEPLADVAREVARLRADTVAVAHSPGMTTELLRRLCWVLEGSGVQLLVAPAFTDIAGPRINVRPVSGLPLLQIAEPEFTGARRVAKHTFDRVMALLLLVVSWPLLLAAAAAVKVSSPGPVIFRQTRIGRGGKPFTMLKFRSMYADAEARLAELQALNETGGLLFKIRDDPRMTRLGRHLRRYSIDELPQLINVLLGQMSLVGPRPPLPAEVARYEPDAHRKLLVAPGLTGLWQVSGRSELSWDATVRLDLYYVQNWSVALDMEILWKTASAVVRGSGAH